MLTSRGYILGVDLSPKKSKRVEFGRGQSIDQIRKSKLDAVMQKMTPIKHYFVEQCGLIPPTR